jgi:hypothetical protein
MGVEPSSSSPRLPKFSHRAPLGRDARVQGQCHRVPPVWGGTCPSGGSQRPVKRIGRVRSQKAGGESVSSLEQRDLGPEPPSRLREDLGGRLRSPNGKTASLVDLGPLGAGGASDVRSSVSSHSVLSMELVRESGPSESRLGPRIAPPKPEPPGKLGARSTIRAGYEESPSPASVRKDLPKRRGQEPPARCYTT